MKIGNKIGLSFLITAIILTTITVSIMYAVAGNTLEQAIHEHLMTPAQSRANHMETFLDEHKQTIELLGSGSRLKELLSTSKATPGYNQFVNYMKEPR